MLERQLIGGLVRAATTAGSPEERHRDLVALRDLVEHADPTLDAALFDTLTKQCLQRAGLWQWAGSVSVAEAQCTNS
jgi:hypothetical protein